MQAVLDADEGGEMTPEVPDYVLDNVALHLATYAEYRHQLALARGLDRRFGGDGRYVDDVKRNLGAGLRTSRRALREFTRLAKANGVDPSAVMRGMRSK